MSREVYCMMLSIKRFSKTFVSKLSLVLIVVVFAGNADTSKTRPFEDYFTGCKRNDADFDECIKYALNSVTPFFKPGVPAYNVTSFDPFFIPRAVHRHIGSMLIYVITLTNVSESGWTQSRVTRFKSSLEDNQIKYTQFFPDKYVNGNYDFEGSIVGFSYKTSGTFNITLLDYIQTTIVSRPRFEDADGVTSLGPLKVRMLMDNCRQMQIQVSNLLHGHSINEYLLSRLVNVVLGKRFILLKPTVDELVSDAFTKVFNDALKDFPFEKVIAYQ